MVNGNYYLKKRIASTDELLVCLVFYVPLDNISLFKDVAIIDESLRFLDFCFALIVCEHEVIFLPLL